MQKNEEFVLEIVDQGTDGEGIGRYEGMTFFVKDTVIGDRIRAKATKIAKNYGYARVEEVLSPSTFRVEAPCPLARPCGGCQLEALDYDRQLDFKYGLVRNNLIRLGGFAPEEIDRKMLPIVGMEQPWRYRNKAQFPVGRDRDGRVVTGFYAARTHTIIPVDDCLLGVKENREILMIIRKWMEKYRVPAYDEKTGKGMVRHVLVRYGFTSREIMVCLIINAKKLPHKEELCLELKKIPGMTSIDLNINMDRTNVILGRETVCIWGSPYIRDTIHLLKIPERAGENTARAGAGHSEQHTDFFFTGDNREKTGDIRSDRSSWEREGTSVDYCISPQSFYQVNPVQTEKLYSTALDFAGLTGQETVWDLYCGIGTISLFLAGKARQVYGVEIVPQAIEDAGENARRNGLTNTKFFVGKAEEVLPAFYRERTDGATGSPEADDRDMCAPDVIVVDPPRKGCDQACLATMLMMAPKRIVYVSCDSATLARDLKILCTGGYELRKVQAFDQFAHSVHVETVVCLIKQNAKAKHHVNVGIDAEEYYQMKKSR